MVKAIREAAVVCTGRGSRRGEGTMARYAIIAYDTINAD